MKTRVQIAIMAFVASSQALPVEDAHNSESNQIDTQVTTQVSEDPVMSARSAHIDRLFAMFRSHYDHGTTAQFFAHSCMTSRLTRADVTQRLGPGCAIDNTLLTNRPPMNARLYFVWPGVPLVAFHYDNNDTLVFINDGIRYWGTPPRDYLEYYGCTNTWSLPAEGEAAQLRDTIGPAIRKLLRDQGHNI